MIRTLHRYAVPTGLIAAVVFIPAPAHAASPQPTKFSHSEPFTDTDFCGTGETVEGTFSIKGVQFLSPKKADFAEVFQGRQTFTFGDTTVINHFAGRFTSTTVSVEENGERTIAFANKGLQESFRVSGGGGVLTRDAGTITFFVTFDANGEPIPESFRFTASGPHPQADSDFTLFCEVMPEALGIE